MQLKLHRPTASARVKKDRVKRFAPENFLRSFALRYRRRLPSNTRVYYEIGTRILQTMVLQAFAHGKKTVLPKDLRFCWIQIWR